MCRSRPPAADAQRRSDRLLSRSFIEQSALISDHGNIDELRLGITQKKNDKRDSGQGHPDMIDYSFKTRIAIFAALPGLLLACTSATAQSSRGGYVNLANETNVNAHRGTDPARESYLNTGAANVAQQDSPDGVGSPGLATNGAESGNVAGNVAGNVPGIVDDGYGYSNYEENFLQLRRFDLAYASTDLLFFNRDVGALKIAGVQGVNEFFEGELKHGIEPGFRTNLGVRLWGTGFVEARFAMVGGWNAGGSWESLPVDPDALSVSADFQADFYSTEVNLVAEDWVYNQYQVLLGLRIIETGDSFSTTLSSTNAGTESFSGRADNSLFGIQTGFRTGCFYRESVWSCSLIGGVLSNDVSQSGPRYVSALDVDAMPGPSFSIHDEEISGFVDFEATVAYPITEFAFVRIGYQALVIGNLVTVTRQNGAPANPGSIAFHGGYVGLEFAR